VKAIVEASGGAVAVTSDPSGVTFVVRLPVDPAAASEPSTRGRAVQLPDAPTP